MAKAIISQPLNAKSNQVIQILLDFDRLKDMNLGVEVWLEDNVFSEPLPNFYGARCLGHLYVPVCHDSCARLSRGLLLREGELPTESVWTAGDTEGRIDESPERKWLLPKGEFS